MGRRKKEPSIGKNIVCGLCIVYGKRNCFSFYGRYSENGLIQQSDIIYLF